MRAPAWIETNKLTAAGFTCKGADGGEIAGEFATI